MVSGHSVTLLVMEVLEHETSPSRQKHPTMAQLANKTKMKQFLAILNLVPVVSCC